MYKQRCIIEHAFALVAPWKIFRLGEFIVAPISFFDGSLIFFDLIDFQSDSHRFNHEGVLLFDIRSREEG